MMTEEDLRGLIASVDQARQNEDEEKIFDLATDVMSVYLEALSDVHFGGEKIEWLNDIVMAIDDGDSEKLIAVIEEEEDRDDRFLGSQVAALFAGFRQRDSMITIAQAVGIEALLENM